MTENTKYSFDDANLPTGWNALNGELSLSVLVSEFWEGLSSPEWE